LINAVAQEDLNLNAYHLNGCFSDQSVLDGSLLILLFLLFQHRTITVLWPLCSQPALAGMVICNMLPWWLYCGVWHCRHRRRRRRQHL